MINEVDESLRSLVKEDVVRGGDIEVLFEAPNRDWAARRNSPTIDLYLYDLREDLKRRSAGMVEHRDTGGLVTERRPLPRYFKLAYLITAWTQRPEDEHRLLSAVLASLMRHETVPAAHLTPLLASAGLPIGLQIAYPPPDDRQVSDVWSSLGGDLKPALDLVVTMAIQPDTFYDIAQAVMAPLRLRAVGTVTTDVVDDLKEGRAPAPTGPTPAEADHNATTGGSEPAAPVATVTATPRPRRKRPPES